MAYEAHLWYGFGWFYLSHFASITMELISIALIKLSSSICTLRGAVTNFISNTTSCKIMCLVGFKPMIHLHTILECFNHIMHSKCIVVIVLCIICIFIFFWVLCFIIKTHNLAQFAFKKIRPYNSALKYHGTRIFVEIPWWHPHVWALCLCAFTSCASNTGSLNQS